MLCYELSCEFVHETEMAVLLRFGGDEGDTVWVPLSLIENHDDEFSFVSLPEWFVVQEGLDEYV